MKIQALLFSFFVSLFICGASLVLALPALSDPQSLLQASSLAEKTPVVSRDNVEHGVVPQAISGVMTADDQMQNLRDENDRLHETVRMFSNQIEHLKKLISRGQNQSEGYGDDHDRPRRLGDDDHNHRSDEQWRSGHWGRPGNVGRPKIKMMRKRAFSPYNSPDDEEHSGCPNCDPRGLAHLDEVAISGPAVRVWGPVGLSMLNDNKIQDADASGNVSQLKSEEHVKKDFGTLPAADGLHQQSATVESSVAVSR